MLLVLLHQHSFLPSVRHRTTFLRPAAARLRAAAEELPPLTFDDIATWVKEKSGEDPSLTYGEITPRGFRTLAQRLRLAATDVFVDLGSGHGKAVVQSVAEMGVSAGVGVEIAQSRHDKAEALRATLPTAEAERVTFVLGDCADAAPWTGPRAPLAGATVVYVASLPFDRLLLERVAARLAAAPQLRTVATLRRFPSGMRGFDECEPRGRM